MSATFQTTYDDREYLFPVFKFMSNEHAAKLCDSGNVHVPNLNVFRNRIEYPGSVGDDDEGRVTIRNRFTHFDGIAKDANGLLALNGGPYDRLRFANEVQMERTINFPNALVYCVTQHLFTNSVQHWANERGKDACILISDFSRLLKFTNERISATAAFISAEECLYVGRLVEETNPGSESRSNFLLSNPELISFYKPKEHAPQREVRAVWLGHDIGNPLSAFNVDIPEVRSLCLRIDYSSIRVATSKNINLSSVSIGALVHRKHDKKPASYKLGPPTEVCSPIMWRNCDSSEWHFGFRYPPNGQKTISEGSFDGTGIGISHIGGPIGLIMCDEIWDDISHIEMVCE